MSQRLFLVRIGPDSGGDSARDFTVLGSTGNVYTVTVSGTPGCDCPDGRRGNICKHLIFVFVRVLGLPQDSPLVRQRGLLPTEVAAALRHRSQRAQQRAATGRYGASDAVRRTLSASAGADADDDDDVAEEPLARRDSVDDDCSICFEVLGPATQTTLCGSCRNSFHAACLAQLAKHHRGAPPCPMCREPIAAQPAAAGKKRERASGGMAGHEEGYANVRALQPGALTRRDASSYHESEFESRRSRRW